LSARLSGAPFDLTEAQVNRLADGVFELSRGGHPAFAFDGQPSGRQNL